MWMGLCVLRQGENTWKEGEIWANWNLRTKDLGLSAFLTALAIIVSPAEYRTNRRWQGSRRKHPPWYFPFHWCFQRNSLCCQAWKIWEAQTSPRLGWYTSQIFNLELKREKNKSTCVHFSSQQVYCRQLSLLWNVSRWPRDQLLGVMTASTSTSGFLMTNMVAFTIYLMV